MIVDSLLPFLRTKIFNKRIPLFVGWALTSRCNMNCKYCAVNEVNNKELDRREIFDIINQLKQLGTRFISFTGGEPLLREDIDDIINYCKRKRIYISVNSNGWDLDRIKLIKEADLIVLSLDGNRGIHDIIRKEGSYGRVLEAADMINNMGIELNFAATLTSINLGQINFLINQAKKFHATVTFQPATLNLLYSKKKNPIAPAIREYRQAIKEIIKHKQRDRFVINNSLTGLKHLLNWPRATPLKCSSGRITCRIQSDGTLYLCNRTREINYNIKEAGVENAFLSLPVNFVCGHGWCAQRVELNLLYNFKWESVLNAFLILMKKEVIRGMLKIHIFMRSHF